MHDASSLTRAIPAAFSDSNIKNVTPNDLGIILSKAKIERVFANGQKARSLYKKHLWKRKRE